MFLTPGSLRFASWAALFVAVAYLAAAFAMPEAQRQSPPFTPADPQKQLEDVARLFALAITVGLLQLAQALAGVVACVALAAHGARPTHAFFGGGFAVLAFLALAARGVWSAAVETSAGVQFIAARGQPLADSMVTFLHHNLLFQHFFNWFYVLFAGGGLLLLAWSLSPRDRRLAAALGVAGITYLVYFPVVMFVYHSTRVHGRPFPAVMLLAEVAVWLFPGLAFLLAFLWLRLLALAAVRAGL